MSKTKTTHQDYWVTLAEAAEITRFSRKYLVEAMHAIDAGFHLPYCQHQPGAPYRIRYRDLVAWMEQRTI